MPINTKLKVLTPSRARLATEITLLSHGFSCPVAFPEGKITVYPWDSSISDWLIDQKRLGTRPGMVTPGLISKLCNLNGADINKFVLGDVPTVLLVARAIVRDNKIEFDSTCPVCGHKAREGMTIPDGLEKVGEKDAEYKGTDIITLPVSQDEVEVRPLLVEDEAKMRARDNPPHTPTYVKVSERVASLLYPIVSIGGGKPDTIRELVSWFDALHPRDQIALEEQELQLTPHLDQRVKLECDACKHQYLHPLVIDDEFFR